MTMTRRTATFLGGAAAAVILQQSNVEGKAIRTCQEQWDCMDWTVNPSIGCAAADGNCVESYKVCVTIHAKSDAHPTCPDRSFSHYCPLPDCSDDGIPAPFTADSATKGMVPFVQCQHAGAGDTLFFVFKDGKGCDATSDEFPPVNVDVCDDHYTLECFPRTEDFDTCTNVPSEALKNQIGKECIWKVTLPEACPDCVTTTPTSSSSEEGSTTTSEETATSTTAEEGSTSTTAEEGSTSTTAEEGSTTSPGEESMPDSPGLAADPLGNIGLAESSGRILGGGMPALAFVAVAGVASAVAASLIALGRRARARTAEHEPLQPATQQD